MTDADRQEVSEVRRRSFDAVAERYATARPGYPEAVFDAIAQVVPPPADVLEIGPGPGQATVPLAERGYRILAVELGRNLARVARRRLAAFPEVRVVRGDFHDWRIPNPGSFDLVVSASAFHWIDTEVGLARAQRALRPGGWLGLVWNHTLRGRAGSRSRAFWDQADELYRRHAPSLVPYDGKAERREVDRRAEIRRGGLFHPAARRSWRWRRRFTADEYLELLGTYSDHLTMPPDQRHRLFASLRRVIDGSFDGAVVREYLTVLYLAQARGPAE